MSFQLHDSNSSLHASTGTRSHENPELLSASRTSRTIAQCARLAASTSSLHAPVSNEEAGVLKPKPVAKTTHKPKKSLFAKIVEASSPTRLSISVKQNKITPLDTSPLTSRLEFERAQSSRKEFTNKLTSATREEMQFKSGSDVNDMHHNSRDLCSVIKVALDSPGLEREVIEYNIGKFSTTKVHDEDLPGPLISAIRMEGNKSRGAESGKDGQLSGQADVAAKAKDASKNVTTTATVPHPTSFAAPTPQRKNTHACKIANEHEVNAPDNRFSSTLFYRASPPSPLLSTGNVEYSKHTPSHALIMPASSWKTASDKPLPDLPQLSSSSESLDTVFTPAGRTRTWSSSSEQATDESLKTSPSKESPPRLSSPSPPIPSRRAFPHPGSMKFDHWFSMLATDKPEADVHPAFRQNKVSDAFFTIPIQLDVDEELFSDEPISDKPDFHRAGSSGSYFTSPSLLPSTPSTYLRSSTSTTAPLTPDSPPESPLIRLHSMEDGCIHIQTKSEIGNGLKGGNALGIITHSRDDSAHSAKSQKEIANELRIEEDGMKYIVIDDVFNESPAAFHSSPSGPPPATHPPSNPERAYMISEVKRLMKTYPASFSVNATSALTPSTSRTSEGGYPPFSRSDSAQSASAVTFAFPSASPITEAKPFTSRHSIFHRNRPDRRSRTVLEKRGRGKSADARVSARISMSADAYEHASASPSDSSAAASPLVGGSSDRTGSLRRSLKTRASRTFFGHGDH
ncbi:hypothetical protein MMC25_002052 [Agyrium rufum]|nr:hypothetical protein [Agyrium rufum]